MIEGTCNRCSRRVVWIVDEKGTKLPVDPVAPCYIVSDNFAGDYAPGRESYQATRERRAMVSHFATCRGAPAAPRPRPAGMTRARRR